MLKLLIADDEKVIRESLAECIDWESLGIYTSACCANGIEVLEACIDELPDIVLTDIKMPGLSGLELIEHIQMLDKHVEIIIISGFREFEFAQKAMELGVRRYLLKPVEEDKLLTAALEAKKALANRRPAVSTKKIAAPNGNELIHSVMEYVKANLSNSELSLKKIAGNHVYLNADYLSRLFVQTTGEKFSHYLNRTRVEAAKRMLLEGEEKISLVAEQVGCGHNPRYFSQVFKKYAGTTPSDFAKIAEQSDIIQKL